MRPLLIFFLSVFIARWAIAQHRGSVRTDTIVSAALAGNLTGENPARAVSIYLPPGYDGSRRYPVLYLLHGIGDDNMDFMDDSLHAYSSVEALMDEGCAAGQLSEMIIVTPDEKTNWYGSFYTNSVATGNWEDFTVNELVSYIDTHYRTRASADSRAIAGHSMGGYGAVLLAMKHPDVFGVAYGMNSAFIGFVGELVTDNDEVKRFVQASTAQQYRDLFTQKHFIAVGMLSVAQAFSPDPRNPPLYISKPFKKVGAAIVVDPVAYGQWQQHDVVRLAGRYKANLLKLRSLKFDSGTGDEYKFIPIANRLFSKRLTALGVPHQFEEYNGDHRNRLWGQQGRINTELLPFISANLVK